MMSCCVAQNFITTTNLVTVSLCCVDVQFLHAFVQVCSLSVRINIQGTYLARASCVGIVATALF